jgi:tetratricopeptide (TPR) repeat protein
MRDQNNYLPRLDLQKCHRVRGLGRGALIVFVMVVPSLSIHAQIKTRPEVGPSLGQGCTTGSERGCYTPPLIGDIPPLTKPAVANDEKCLPWNLSAIQVSAVSATALKISSKARGEYEKACDAFQGRKFADAEQHLRGAIAKTQDYPAAWVMLGVVLDEQHKEQEARDACTHAITISGKYLPAYLCAAEFSARNREWDQLLALADAALRLNSEKNGYGYYYQGLANFNLKDFAGAQKSALHAAEIDASHSYLPLYFLLARIYEAQGDKITASTYLRQILKLSKNPEQTEAVTKYLADLEAKSSPKNAPKPKIPGDSFDEEASDDLSSGATVGSMAEFGKTDESWVPPDVDHADWPVASGVACPQQAVLDAASKKILELAHNVDRFTATEVLIHQPVDRAGQMGSPVTVQFNYLVSYTPSAGGYLNVDEYRNGSLSHEGFPSQIATIGTPSLVLIFHPQNINNFDMKCEGLGHWHGEPAWQIRFEQREDRPNLTAAFVVGRVTYPVNLRGRAWILADSFQVARLETDLKESIPKIHLQLSHLSIEYRPIQSPTEKAQLWLPSSAEVYMNFRGRRFYRKHVFTDFKIFSVDNQYQISGPKKAADAP